MVEYDVDPPLERDSPFGPALLRLHVTDDIEHEAYPTQWEDFPWPFLKWEPVEVDGVVGRCGSGRSST